MKNIIVGNKKQEYIQTGVKSTTGCIAIGLKGHYFPEQRVKKIDNPQQESPDMFMQVSHQCGEGRA